MRRTDIEVINGRDANYIIPFIINLRANAWKSSDLAAFSNEVTDLYEYDVSTYHFIFRRNKKIIGAARIRLAGEIGFLDRLFVCPSYRSNGVAKELTLYRIAFLKKMGIIQIRTVIRASIMYFYEKTYDFKFIESINSPFPNSAIMQINNIFNNLTFKNE